MAARKTKAKPRLPKQTERSMLDLVRAKYNSVNPGNGPRYVVAEHVRSGTGFDAKRTADALVIDCWPSQGLEVTGLEVKCSRSDWLVELKDPTKAEEFKRYCDRWWLVIADPDMVKPGELPEGWGMMVPSVKTVEDWNSMTGKRTRRSVMVLRTVVKAPLLQAEPIPKTMLVSLLRSTQTTGVAIGQEKSRESAYQEQHDRARLDEANAWMPLEDWEHKGAPRMDEWEGVRGGRVDYWRDLWSTPTRRWKELVDERRKRGTLLVQEAESIL